MTREELRLNIKTALAVLHAAEAAFEVFEGLAVNNVYESLEAATPRIEGKLLSKAHEDCEGSHCLGNDIYEQEFMVGSETYVAVLEVEYDRHDKTYYYVTSSNFRTKKL